MILLTEEIRRSPVDMENFPSFIGFYTFQVVVWDFFHIWYKRDFSQKPRDFQWHPYPNKTSLQNCWTGRSRFSPAGFHKSGWLSSANEELNEAHQHRPLNLTTFFKSGAGWCSTLTLLLICSSFSRENCHPLLICSSLSTAQGVFYPTMNG